MPGPTASCGWVLGDVHVVHVRLSSRHSNVAGDSVAVKTNRALRALVTASGCPVIELFGAVVSATGGARSNDEEEAVEIAGMAPEVVVDMSRQVPFGLRPSRTPSDVPYGPLGAGAGSESTGAWFVGA